jgi:UDP-N-acetylglucosamine--N-acetylmuramyl-(pentapeptide) pyrophosphoryl-undecaprenol N-acetylglucosamine transferase
MTTVGLPAAYVPLPHGNGEQRLNALPIERAGGGLIVDDAALSPQWICEVLLPVMLDTPLVAGMSAAAARLGSRDTDDRLAYEVMNIIAGRPSRSRAAHGR